MFHIIVAKIWKTHQKGPLEKTCLANLYATHVSCVFHKTGPHHKKVMKSAKFIKVVGFWNSFEGSERISFR